MIPHVIGTLSLKCPSQILFHNIPIVSNFIVKYYNLKYKLSDIFLVFFISSKICTLLVKVPNIPCIRDVVC